MVHTHSSHAHKNGSSPSDRNRSGSEEISSRSENFCGKGNAICKKKTLGTNIIQLLKSSAADPDDPCLNNLPDPLFVITDLEPDPHYFIRDLIKFLECK